MTERERSASTTGYQFSNCKMENGMGPRKTTVIIVIVVGCFAVLWPKVFYPMLVGSANQLIQPSSIDKTTGCCDVISEIDVNTIKIMNELCGTIIPTVEDGKPLSGKEVVQRCRQEILETCGIDIAVVLQDHVRLGRNVKQILDEIRSLNGSLCLKYNYGVAPWRLGVPHRVTVKISSDSNIRQERPLHLRSELIHPAFRERGRAIPQTQSQASAPPRPPPRVVEGRPGPVPGMRPTIGGAGHVVPPSKQGTSSMSVIMPIYTIGIVIFFTYTLMKVVFRKQPEGVGGALYPPVEPDPTFRKEVFESEKSRLAPRLSRESISTKLVVNAMSALLDEVDQEIEARRKTNEVASQDLANGTLSNGDVLKPQDNEEQPTVKVLGMEMTASCEGGKKWSRPESPVLPTTPLPPVEPVPPPQEIYLEGALPAQSHLLVSDSATESQTNPADSEDDPAVVLAGKMTLSVISLDASDKGAEEETNVKLEEPEVELVESDNELETEIEEILRKYQSNEETEPEPLVKFEEDIVEMIEEPVIEPVIKFKEELEKIESVLKESVIEPLFGEEVEKNDLDSVVALKDETKVINSTELTQPLTEFKEEIKEDTIPVVKFKEDTEEILDVAKDDAGQAVPLQPETKEVIDVVESQIVPIDDVKEEIKDTVVQPAESEATPKPIVAFKEEIRETVESDAATKEPVVAFNKEIRETVESDAAPKDPVAAFNEEIRETVESDAALKQPVAFKEDIREIVETDAVPKQPVAFKEDIRETVESDVHPKESVVAFKEEIKEAVESGVASKQPVVGFKEVNEPGVKFKEQALIIDDDDDEEEEEEVEEIEVEEVERAVDDLIQEAIENITQRTPINHQLTETQASSCQETVPSPVASTERVASNEQEVEDEESSDGEVEESDEEVEIVYESSEEESEEENNAHHTEPSPIGRVNGQSLLEESKYNTVSSSATAAENDISDEEVTDNEEVDEDEEEIIEIEEDEEEEANNVNHLSGESESED